MYAEIKKNGWHLVISGTSEVYVNHHSTPAPCPWEQRLFVGRFKYARPGTNARSFAKFAAANFTPAEYLARVAAGETPLAILKSKGYVSPNERRARRLDAELVARQYRERTALHAAVVAADTEARADFAAEREAARWSDRSDFAE